MRALAFVVAVAAVLVAEGRVLPAAERKPTTEPARAAKPAGPMHPKKVDHAVSVRISRIRDTNSFRVEVASSEKGDIVWWAAVDALLYDSKGKLVPTPGGKGSLSWFTWKEDTEPPVYYKGEQIQPGSEKRSHFAYYRKENPLVETLVLDTTHVKPGRYWVKPLVTTYKQKAAEAARGPQLMCESAMHPGKVTGCWFTLKKTAVNHGGARK